MASESRPNLPFALPDITDAEIAEVVAALRSGWVSTGPRTREFEQAFAARLGEGLTAVAVNSATAGLHLALEALGVTRGDEVLVPTWTFTATAEVVRYLDADPVFVDVEQGTLNIDLADAARKVTSRTKAMIPVHFAGYPVELDALEAWSAHHQVPVLEDAAHALPARSGGRLVGSASTAAAVFSFYATKTITTGEGGMVVTRDQGIADRARVMRLHGIDRDAFGRYQSDVPSWQYDVIAPGFKYNMSDMAAGLGLIQLQRAEEMRAARELIADRYREAFSTLPVTLPVGTVTPSDHAWHLFVIRLAEDSPVSRDEFIREMSRAGIGTSVHFIPLHLMTYWRERYALDPVDFPVASAEFERAVSLPIYSAMTDADVDRVIDAVRSVLR